MPSARKRSLLEADAGQAETLQQPSMLHRIRNMWQFANLFQFTVLFGKVLKIDDNLDIEDLEMECLKQHSSALQDLGLSFLKFLSSHRGLTNDLFDDYTRRQFLAKAPAKNPFGDGEEPLRFAEFDVYTKIRVLQQMTQLIMMNPERLRDKTEEQKDMEQTNWRIEPYGWDRDDRIYYVLDDNRIYRQTEAPAPAPAPKPKKNSRKARASLRASKRRRISAAEASDDEAGDDELSERGHQEEEPADDGLGGMKWECVAVSLDEVRQFVSSIQKTKDNNEKVLRDQIQDHLVPILEKQEESRKRKILQREKELLSLEKMAHAKRSSRLANKAEYKKQEEHAREEQRKRREDEASARKEEQARLKMEHERDGRLMSRANRLKEREERRKQHEEELALLSEDSKSIGTGAGRLSERRLQAEIERNKQALREIDEEEDDWIFDCVCGVYGQIDDGTHSVSCEMCNVWQHSSCLKIPEEEAEREDFHFVCESCRRREAEKAPPKIIKIKINRPGSSSSAAQQCTDDATPPRPRSGLVVELGSKPLSWSSPVAADAGPSSKPNGMPTPDQPSKQSPNASADHPQGNGNGIPSLSHIGPGMHPFSSPHPNLSPPDQSPNKSRAYDTIHDQSSPINATDGRPSVGVKQQTKMAGAIAGSGSNTSPSKPALPPPLQPTKTSPSPLPVLGPPAVTPSQKSELVIHTPSAAGTKLATPGPSQIQPQEARCEERSSPLPPSRGGLSPIKHSPPLPQRHHLSHSNGDRAPHVTAATPKAAVFPPIAALSPSPQQQIMTPPVKPAEPARVAGHQPQGAQLKIQFPPASS